MPKPNYSQHYRVAWEKLPELKDWLAPVPKNSDKAYCKFCKCTLNTRLGDLKDHATRIKHKKAAEPFSSNRQQKINFPTVNQINQTSIAEARLAMYCAMHTSLISIDHLSENCNKIFQDAAATPLRIHRSKCTAINNNCLGPHFKKELLQDIGDGPFGLIIDESTDISIIKMLGVVIKYFSIKQKTIVSTYLALIQLDNGTADSIVAAIVDLLEKCKLNLNKLAGIGTDNAAVMSGVNNGVYEKLKRTYRLKNLVLIRCVCHSLQLALSAATEETIPRSVDFMIKETYNWFQHSTIKQLAYSNTYKLINDDKKPLKILQLSKTRWISIEPAVKRILDQHLELRTHFEIVRKSEACYTAELLYSMYSDPVNKVYLSFLHPILAEVQKVNKTFESAVADPMKLFQDLLNLVKSIASTVIHNFNTRRNLDVFTLTSEQIDSYVDPKPYLGYSFEVACEQNNIQKEEKEILKRRCFNFLVKLLKELVLRLPTNVVIFKKINTFCVSECLKPVREPITDIAAEYYDNDVNKVTRIERQWMNLTSVQWQNVNNTIKFWSEVFFYKDASGENPFQDLCDLVQILLTLPHSNANVERVFSQMNIVKSKLRNRMCVNTLNNIILIRFGLKRNQVCCNDYDIPMDVLKNIGTSNCYVSEKYGEEEEDLIGHLTIGCDL